MEDLELELEQIGREMRFCKICGSELTGNQRNYCKEKACKLTANNLMLKRKREEARSKLPKYICQHCGFVMQLDFEPRLNVNIKRLNDLTCSNCGTKRACS